MPVYIVILQRVRNEEPAESKLEQFELKAVKLGSKVFNVRLANAGISSYNCPSLHNNNNNNNKHDNVYGAVIMAEPLREFTRFI